jgi:integral membrane protein
VSLLSTQIGKLRLLGMCEGFSLIALVGFGVPMKHLYGNPIWVRVLGPVHGLFFLLFVVALYNVAYGRNWGFKGRTLKLLISCFIPFGTWYLDCTMLRKIED